MRLLLGSIAALALAGCDRQIAGGKADGAAIFADPCARCHGDAGKPPDAMMRQLNVRDLTAPEFTSRATRELVIAQVRGGSQNGVMPSFAGSLTDAQVEAVSDFVLGLGRK